MRLITLVLVVMVLVGLWVLVRSIWGSEPVTITIVDESTEQTVVGAVISDEGGDTAITDDDGVAEIGFSAPHTLRVTAHGYHPATFRVEEVPSRGELTLNVRPRLLQGRVMDQQGTGLIGATITVDGQSTRSEEFGAFEFSGVEPGEVTISKAAWETTNATWTGEDGRLDVFLHPFVVRGLRVNHVADANALIRMSEGTVINALVFDTRIEDGQVVHEIDVEVARETGALRVHYDVEASLAAAKAAGMYTITRIVTFQDPIVAPVRPEWAVMDSATGDVWRNDAGYAWLDPTNTAAWEYPLDLAVAACNLGFDEIQFDYVRFPSDGNIATAVYAAGDMNGSDNELRRVTAIADFLVEARSRVHAVGCAVSADIFGITASANNDQGIGQRVEELSWAVDVLSPMVYPSHYSSGWLGLDNPNDHPHDVVSQALAAGAARLEGGALQRPWLQAFFWTTDQTRASIAAAEGFGGGWMLWNASSEFERDWLPPE